MADFGRICAARGKWLLPLILLTALSVRALAQSAAPSSAAASPAAANTPGATTQPESSSAEPIRVDYSAPGSCPGAAAFLDNVLGRTPRARAATAHELARVFRVTVVSRRGETFGEISIKPVQGTAPVRLTAVGKCENVLNTLAQFAAIGLDPAVSLAPSQELELPQNPYRNWSGPIAEPLPDNPYRQWSGPVSRELPENPYRSPRATLSSELPDNPYRRSAAPPELPGNPHRSRLRGRGF